MSIQPLTVCFLAMLFLLRPGLLFAEGHPRIYGLVIGHNGAGDTNKPALRYADDDAVKNAQLLKEMGAKYVLLTQLDADSQQQYPNITATAPDLAAVHKAVAELNRKMEQEKTAAPSHLFLFYSGHGDVQNNEGYVQLRDQQWSRQQFIDLLSSIQADAVHVVVDACKSFYFVFERGQQRRPAQKPFLYEQPSKLPAHVGFILSTSSAQQSHEWEAIQSGVFSHEVRSAMRGAADLNADGAISYQELSLFVYVANKTIPNPRYRPALFARGPGGAPLETSRLITLPKNDTWLEIGPGIEQHFYLETASGIRVADLHPAKTLVVRLQLPLSRPLFLRAAQSDTEYRIDQEKAVYLAELVPSTSTSVARGSEEEAFAKIFETALSTQQNQAYQQHLKHQGRAQQHQTGVPSWMQPATIVASAGLLAVGGTCTAVALAKNLGTTEQTDNRTRLETNGHIDVFNGLALAFYGAAIASAAAALAIALTNSAEPEVTIEE